MIVLDIVGLVVAVGVFVYCDRRPWILETDGTERPMTLTEWMHSDKTELISED